MLIIMICVVDINHPTTGRMATYVHYNYHAAVRTLSPWTL